MKKVFPFILITVVILGIFFVPFKASAAITCINSAGGTTYYPNTDTCPSGSQPFTSYVGGQSVSKEANQNLNGSCNPLNWDTINCVLSAGALIAQYAIWMPVNLFTAIGGYAMDTSISLTVTGSIFSGLANEENGVVSAGWGLSRDIVNIFLIFILLYIAIATILQLSGYGAKQLLATLIIIAFLVNFSGVITKLIIDASNVLAMGFYDSFEKDADGQIRISKTFKDAFNMEKIVTADFKEILKGAGTPQRDIYIVTFLTYILGAGIAAIAGFIFFVFAVLFLIRMVVLLILLILAPLAFGAMVLPSTKKHASDWWHQLFSQAFFAPAGLFMLWISAKMANSSFIKEIFNIPQAGMANMIADAQTKSMNWDSIAKFVVQFVIIAIMLIASIIVSKKMGAIGADAVQKGVTKGLRKAQGYAGKVGRLGRRGAGLAAEGILKGEGKAATTIKSLPLVSRGLAGASAWEKERKEKQIKEYEKGYSKYSQAGLEALRKDPTIFGAKREGLQKAINKIRAEEKKKEEKGIRRKELDAAIEGGNIMEIMATSARMQAAAAEETGEAAEKLSAAAEKETKTAKVKEPPPKT